MVIALMPIQGVATAKLGATKSKPILPVIIIVGTAIHSIICLWLVNVVILTMWQAIALF